ncbi:fumarylacetoacetate hydrolase family protein [Rhizobium sp. FKY42]|uniref:fumarylacetoacetate hydrolase family protein n=1 Tax=Rhizobium sp. FKY42 TaxID=2562310 RepID=UPI0010C0F2A5|nr:fumarylacetoacetate hydrolase family protein [Rhizobium sp. FKY42]
MEFVSFETGQGTGYGLLQGTRIRRLDQSCNRPATLKGLLAELDRHDLSDGPDLDLDAVTLLPPIPDPGKVFCVASNFREGKPAPDYPLLFTRCAEAQTGHRSPILMPAVSDSFDFEGELAVVIGQPGHKIERSRAWHHIAGYACFNDGSVRDWQKHSSQFTPGKNFYRSAGFGPSLVTPDAVPDFTALTLTTRVNGEVKQQIGMADMIFDPAWLIAYISTFCPLNAGDVIVTGTPGGFGATREPKEFLSVGDVVEVEIPSVGHLINPVTRDHDLRSELFS